ncbi:WD40 repeat-like protein [Exidia glandulosa HHB12029]|uniref:WD40 repeat-like protein n=1 Tax=Exidia glandulosa HHB12029 TaxID=1314781 RepID=A0A166N3E6_EXIGL|nr:WD40 repeat-like protein [Exidia glandulosa HHB12029]
MTSLPHGIASDRDLINLASSTLSTDITKEVHDVSLRPVGHGGYSDIYTGTWSSPMGELAVAIKVVRAAPADPGIKKIQRRLEKEISVWKGLVHHNVQKLSGLYTGVGLLPALVSPWCKNGDINSFVQRLKSHPDVKLEKVKLDLLIGVTTGLQFLHTRRIVHGDIKGGNILISDDGVPLLCDFGLSRIIAEHSESMTQTGLTGTLRWMAPELLLEDGMKHSYASDVWACGCLFMEVWTGLQPYYTKTTQTQVLLALSRHEGPSRPPEMPDFIWSRVQECCNFDSSQRPPPWHITQSLSSAKIRSSIDIGMTVYSVAWFPDGIRVVVGCASGSMHVLNLDTGATLLRLDGHTDAVLQVAVSPSGKFFASCSDDRSIRLWDAETGHAIGAPMIGHTRRVWSVAFSPDGRHIVSGSEDETIRIWSTESCTTVLGPLHGHTASVSSVAYSPDGSRIVSSSWDNTVRVWDARTGDPILTLRGHSDWVRSAVYSPDGLRVVSGSDDHTVRIWDATTGQRVGIPLEGHSGSVWSVAYSPDGTRIASGSCDHTIRIWDAVTGASTVATIRGHMDRVYSVAFSPEGKRLSSASEDGTVRIWDATDDWRRWDI